MFYVYVLCYYVYTYYELYYGKHILKIFGIEKKIRAEINEIENKNKREKWVKSKASSLRMSVIQINQ